MRDIELRRAAPPITRAPADSVARRPAPLDQCEHGAGISHDRQPFLMGVTECYRAHADTRMTITAERLPVVVAGPLSAAVVTRSGVLLPWSTRPGRW